MKKLLKIFAVMFIVSVALLAVAAYVPNGDVADAVTADCTHEYSEVVLAQQPSCTQEGWLEHYTCTLCGKYFVKVGEDMVEVDWEDISSPVLVHKWSDWFVKPATCTEEGGEMRYCALCGKTEHRGETIDATGHNLTHHEAVASTCEVAGNSEYWSCDRCGLYFSDGQGSQPIEENSWILPLAEHTEETIPGKAATCTETGLTDGVKCSVCGTVLVAQQEIPATGHTVVTDEGKAPTCTETGLTEGSHCSVCGTVLVAQQEIPATGHTVVTDEGKAPTCTETGLTEGSHCSVCGTVLVAQQEIPATGHTYDAVTTKNNVCTVCEHEITQAEIVKKLYALESGKALHGTYLLTGIVTNLDDTNATIIVEEKEIYLYSFQSTNTFLVGDSVSVVGTLKHFDNYYEFDKGTVTEVAHPEYKLSFSANMKGCTVTLADGSSVPTSATNGTTYEVKITVPSGYKVASVTVNEAVVDMSESGTYSVTVCGETTVHVEIVSKMFSGMVLEATVDSLALQKTNYTASDGDHEISGYVVNTKDICADSTEKLIQWKKSTGTLTVTGQFSKIVIANTNNYSADSFLITFNNETLTAVVDENGISVDFGGTKEGTVVIKNNTTSVKYISSIQFFATICEHEWGDWTSNGNNTHTRKCSLCGEKVTENCTFENGVCSVCGAQEVVTHSVTVGYTVNGNAATTLPEGVTVEILGKDDQPVTDLANVVEGTITIKVTAEGFDIVVTCNDTPVTMDGGAGTFDLRADATLSVTLTTQTEHKGTAEDPYSVADALAIASVIGQGNYTEKVYIKGLIVDVGSEGDYLSNIYIADTADGTKMLVYSANFSETVATIYEGDTVVFHGYITNFNGTLEIAGKDGDYPEMTAVTRGSRTITVEMENATIATPTGDLPTSAPIESTVTFTVTPDEGYEVVSVKVNGNFITPVDGTYSFVVGETNAVEVTIQKITPKHQVSVSSDVEGYTVTTDNDITLPGEVYEGTLKFTVTAPEGYQVATVSVGETVLTLGDDGYYTTEVAGEITINITFSEVVVLPEENVIIEYSGGSTTNMTGNNDAIIFGLDASIFNIYSIKNSGSVHVGLNKDGTIRLYKNNATTLVISLAEGYTITKIEIDSTSSSLQVKVDNTIVEDSNGQYVINASELSIENGGGSVANINSIIVYYTEPIVCEHVVETWTPNNDGTHTGTCSLCGQEITEDCTFVGEVCEVCEGKQPVYAINISVENATIATPTGDLPGTALHGTELAFTITPEEGFVVMEVKVNGETVEAVEGVYTITVKAEVEIDVAVLEASASVTVEMSTFTATADDLDSNISYTTAKGGGTSNPAINGGEIRLYQNSKGTGGGTITVTASNGKTITAISIGSSMKTSVKYSYYNADGTLVEKTQDLSADGILDLTGISATEVVFTCMGTSSTTRLYVNYLSVTYN